MAVVELVSRDGTPNPGARRPYAHVASAGAGYRWLLASSWATNLGDGIAVAAGPLLVASLTDDAFLVSLAALLRWAPPLVFALSAGVLTDRLDRRRIVLAADGFRAVLVAAGVLLVSRIALPPYDRRTTGLAGVRHDVVEGVRWAVHNPAVRTLCLTILIFNVTFGAPGSSWRPSPTWASR
jgi:transmembrane secretion effector